MDVPDNSTVEVRYTVAMKHENLAPTLPMGNVPNFLTNS